MHETRRHVPNKNVMSILNKKPLSHISVIESPEAQFIN